MISHSFIFKSLLAVTLTLNTGAIASAPPRPFTPVKATTHSFACLGRQTDLENLLLPRQIVAAQQPLLAAPIRLVSEPDILASVKGSARISSKNSETARWEWNGESADL